MLQAKTKEQEDYIKQLVEKESCDGDVTIYDDYINYRVDSCFDVDISFDTMSKIVDYLRNQKIINNRIIDKKIYIVTSGEYSDYGIDAVFTTKEKAVDYVEQHGTYYDIEEYNLDEEVEKKTQLWCIEFRVEDGELCTASPTSYDRNKAVDTCYIFDTFDYRKNIPYIRFYIDADSMDKAVKIARERFFAVKANEYIWLRLTRPYEMDRFGREKYEKFNVKTNEFIKE